MYTGDWVMSIPTNTDRMLFLLHCPHHHHRKKKKMKKEKRLPEKIFWIGQLCSHWSKNAICIFLIGWIVLNLSLGGNIIDFCDPFVEYLIVKVFFFFFICKSEVIVFTSGCYNIDLPTPTRTQRQTRSHIPYLIISAFPLTELLVRVIGWRRLLLFQHYKSHEIVLHLNDFYQCHSQPLTALFF